ncbi:putative DNA helicase [Rosa chinensis]|uniref:Putative DNA helicase n=1 Tax=Rosa chinensis TaxID=74649 RepID=A0A2P6RMF9_ROSCH|nr:putative DNA helicase [Rosa chinensis]
MLIAISNELLDDVNELCLLSFTAAFRNDPVRFDSEVHLHNEAGGYAEWNSSSVSSSSTDKFGFSSFPVEREPYIPKFVEVNYTEGSNDKKWRDGPFPWTKELEANNKRVFGNHSFRLNQREVINATMSGHDVFVLMPIGGGKSLTYQVLESFSHDSFDLFQVMFFFQTLFSFGFYLFFY